MKQNRLTPSPESSIRRIRGHAVILDSELAALYGVTAKRLNEQVKRNDARFPEDFMFQLTSAEWDSLRPQFATLKRGQHRKYLPYVFTEHGAIMAATVLNSSQAISMSLSLVRSFIKLRRSALSVEALSRKVHGLEKGFKVHGETFNVVFDALRQLMAPPDKPKGKIRCRMNRRRRILDS
jgi:hypothetical protein